MESYENILKLDELTEKYQKKAESTENWVSHLKVDHIFATQTS